MPSEKQLVHAKPLAEIEMTEAELRKKLRVAFDRFDEDGSGAVSVTEMGKLVKALKMEVSQAQLHKLMTEADPNGSGDIDFDEFAAALQSQMKNGTGGLRDVFTAAGGAFGWLNPLSWFGNSPAPVSHKEALAAESVAHSTTPSTVGGRRPVAAPRQPDHSPSLGSYISPQMRSGGSVALASRPHSPGSNSNATNLFPGSARSNGSAVSYNKSSARGRPRVIKRSQLFVAQSNHAAAEAVRQQTAAYSEFDEERRAYLLSKQRQRIRSFHKQRKDAKKSVATTQKVNNDTMKQMRSDAEDRHAADIRSKTRYAAKGRQNVLDEKEEQAQSTITRHKNALKAAEEQRQAHAKHRHDLMAQVRAMTAAKEADAKDAADRVRYETRFAVRQEGVALFQSFRNAIARNVMHQYAEDRQAKQAADAAFMTKQRARIEEIRVMERIEAKQAQEQLSQARKHDAENVRQMKEAELEKKRRFMMWNMQQKREKYTQEREHVASTTLALD